MNRGVVVSTLALVLCAGVLGFVLGRNGQAGDEGVAVSRVAALYVAQTGGQAGDCVGVPGQGEVWVRVTCGARLYIVDRSGRITTPQGPQT